MTRNTIETVMGAVVLMVAGVFLWVAYSVTGVQSAGGTRLSLNSAVSVVSASVMRCVSQALLSVRLLPPS